MTPNPLLRGIKYRTFPGGVDYTFDFGLVESEWRAYIRTHPDYGSRATSAHATHRLRDAHGQYVCWDSRISTLSTCQAVAALWADCTEEYIRTGTFSPPVGRPSVGDRSVVAHLNEQQARRVGPRATPPASQPHPAPRVNRPSGAGPAQGSGAFERLLTRIRSGL